MDVHFTRQTLANGLDVIVHEDRDLPIIAVNIWYHVGSRNERPGRTGLAHLFEHLMFEGSANHDNKFFAPLQDAGAILNGSTNADRTNYWEVVPTGALELALWLESDRMAYLLPALTEQKLDTQRDVVLNERRQHYENRPYGLASVALADALYPLDHPYHWTTIGAADDVRTATLDEMREFFTRFYHPANASLVVAGDVNTAEAQALAADYFGAISAGPPAERMPTGNGHLDRERRLILEDRVELPRLYLAWHSPSLFADGDAEMDLASEVLANGKTSRLYRALVYEHRVAIDVAAAQQSRELDGTFQVVATAAPGRDLRELDAAIAAVVGQFMTEGPSEAEMERSRAQIEANFIYRLQTVGGFNGKSDQLNAYNTYVGDPGHFSADLARYQRATGEAVRLATERWLTAPRVALSVVPAGRPELALADSVRPEVS
jgi:zinc protease